jgi:L-lactate dehydrogenase
MIQTSSKVSIIGVGNVGATAAYALTLSGIAREIVLVARDKKKALGEQLDLEHGLPFLDAVNISATDNYADTAHSDVTVITAGAAQTPGESRLELAAKNIAIIEEIIPKVVEHSPNGVIVLVTNPVDILTYKAAQITGLPHGKIFGSGTTLDTARFRMNLSEFLHLNPRSIHAYILGEHGDSSFPVLSSASIGGQLLSAHPSYSVDKATEAFTAAKQAAYNIIAAKGATYYAIGVVISKIVRTILHDNKTILPVSVPLTDFYGINDVSLSVPCIVGRNGVEQVLKISLSDQEQESLRASAAALKKFL